MPLIKYSPASTYTVKIKPLLSLVCYQKICNQPNGIAGNKPFAAFITCYSMLLLLHRKRKPVAGAQGVVYVINHLFTVVAVNGTV